MYDDPEGNAIATIVAFSIGFAIGAGIGAVSSIVSQGFTNGFKNINYGQVCFDAFFGGFSGLISCTSINLACSIIFGGILSSFQSIADDKINGNNVNWLKAISSLIIGGIGGAISGSGADVVDNLGKYKTSKTFVLANHNSIRKKAMYSAKIIAVKKTFVSSSIKYASNVVFATSLSTFLSEVFEWR